MTELTGHGQYIVCKSLDEKRKVLSPIVPIAEAVRHYCLAALSRDQDDAVAVIEYASCAGPIGILLSGIRRRVAEGRRIRYLVPGGVAMIIAERHLYGGSSGRCEIETAALLGRIQQLLEDKKAMDLVVLDVRERSTVTDWIIVASGMSKPHVKALYEELLVRLKHEGVPCYRHNGEVEGGWLVLDYFHIVVHLFLPDVRAFYQIEDLWRQETPLDALPSAPAVGDAVAGVPAEDTVERPARQRVAAAKAPAKRKATSSRPSARKVFEGVSKRVSKSTGKRGK